LHACGNLRSSDSALDKFVMLTDDEVGGNVTMIVLARVGCEVSNREYPLEIIRIVVVPEKTISRVWVAGICGTTAIAIVSKAE